MGTEPSFIFDVRTCSPADGTTLGNGGAVASGRAESGVEVGHVLGNAKVLDLNARGCSPVGASRLENGPTMADGRAEDGVEIESRLEIVRLVDLNTRTQAATNPDRSRASMPSTSLRQVTPADSMSEIDAS